MNSISVVGLINNAALLIVLGMLYNLILPGQRGRALRVRLLIGVSISAIGVLLMLTPMPLGEGIFFDTRSVLLSISGVFFGFIPTLMATLTTAIFRYLQGGAGAWTGIAVIITSSVLGLLGRLISKRIKRTLNVFELYLLGIIVHIAMLLWMLTLPQPSSTTVLQAITLPVLAIYPLCTVLLGILLNYQIARINAADEVRIAKENLYESEKKYRALFETMAQGVVYQDRSGKIILANPAAERILGLSLDKLIGLSSNIPSWYCIHEDGTEFTGDEHPGMVALKTGKEVLDRVMGIRNPHLQETIWININAVPQFKAGQKEPFQVYTTFNDITESKTVQQALEDSEQKFRTLFESMTEGVALHEMIYDENNIPVDYRILDINPAYERHTGLPREQAYRAIASQLYGIGEPPYIQKYSEVAYSGIPFVFETYFAPMKKYFMISVISPKKGEFATVFEDITAQKTRETELHEKNAELERFTYTISHDLKSPLVTIKTFLGYLEQDMQQEDAERTRQDIHYIRNAADKMSLLLEELLEMSRIGRVVNPPVKMRFSDVVNDVINLTAGRISAKEVDVQVNTPDGDLLLFGDRQRISEVFQNLVDNAVKFMGDQPHPKIEIGVEKKDGVNSFYVRDNGVGIEARYHSKVFGLFEKLDSGSEGSGMGLALIKRIVELYKGSIWLESEGKDLGTCFWFTLPEAVNHQQEGGKK